MYRLLPEQVPLSDAVHVKTDCECTCVYFVVYYTTFPSTMNVILEYC